jgi:hypothetical protein
MELSLYNQQYGTTLAFTEANKTATATANLYRTASTRLLASIRNTSKLQWWYADKLFVRNVATASTTKELAEDGSKLINPDVNIYTKHLGNESS